jgi:hypothetical protein
MKELKMKIVTGFVFLLGIIAHGSVAAQSDSTGLPGDNFSLEGALELFKKAGSPEEFEKMINAEENRVNNLDLNEDGETDYVKVIDKSDKDAHAFILQAAVSESESQDIAVIELEKTGDENAVAQIVGDEDIYGEETIVEPNEKVKSNAGTTTTNVVVKRLGLALGEVRIWPVISGLDFTLWMARTTRVVETLASHKASCLLWLSCSLYEPLHNSSHPSCCERASNISTGENNFRYCYQSSSPCGYALPDYTNGESGRKGSYAEDYFGAGTAWK